MRFTKLVLAYAMIGLWSIHARADGPTSTEWFIGPIGFWELMDNADVPKQLDISDDQTKAMESIRQRFLRGFSQNLQQDDKVLSKEQLHAVRIAMNNESILQWQTSLTKVLNEKQLRRLTQLHIQYMGAIGFTTPQMQKALGLTGDQKTQVQAIVDELSNTLRALTMAPINRDGRGVFKKKVLEAHGRAFEKAHALLTESQRTSWKALIGKPFLKPYEGPRSFFEPIPISGRRANLSYP